MEECDYCGSTFEEEGDHLQHLRNEHYDELGRIDRRRVEGIGEEDTEIDPGPILILLIVGMTAAIVLYLFFFVVDDGNGTADAADADQTPYNLGGIHEHGTLEVVVLGDEIDFTEDQYIERDQAFHFHDGYQSGLWHTHAEGVTIEYAMATLGFEISENSLSYDGETYEAPDYEVEITVDGEPVDPETHVLDGVADEGAAAGDAGDDVQILVEEAG